MTCALRWDQCCLTDQCVAPARFSGFCTRCWMALSPLTRALRVWEHTPVTDALEIPPDLQAMAQAPAEKVLSPAETLAMLTAIWAASEP